MSNCSYFEPERQIPVAIETDVLIVGGGTSGICAAIASARTGAKTLLIENGGIVGGTEASGLPWASFNDGEKQITFGIANELAERLRTMGALTADLSKDSWIPFDFECLKLVAAEMLCEESVELLLHTRFVDAIVDSGKLCGVIVENKGGRQAIRSRVIVDCSGDADVAYRAGVPCKIGRNSDGKTQPMTMIFTVGGVDWERFDAGGNCQEMVRSFDRIADAYGFENPRRRSFSGMFRIPGRTGEYSFNVTRVLNCVGTNPVDLTRAELAGRKQVREFVYDFLKPHIKGFENAYLASVASSVGLRETRRIVGEYVMQSEEIREYREHKDAIGRGSYPIDIHSPTDSTTEFLENEHIPGKSYTLPYSILVPKIIDNLLVAGRCVSATHEALSAIRVMPCCMAMGQAAGTAAALCVQNEVVPRNLNVPQLQAKLVQDGVMIGEVLKNA